MPVDKAKIEELRRNYHMAIRSAEVGDTYGVTGCFLIIGALRSDIMREQLDLHGIDSIVAQVETVRNAASKILKLALEGKEIYLEDFGIDPETYEFAFELEDEY